MDLFEARIRIEALREKLDNLAGEESRDVLAHQLGMKKKRHYRNADPTEAVHILQRFAAIRDTLRTEQPALFDDLPTRDIPDPTVEVPGAFGHRGAVSATTVQHWISDMDFALELLVSLEHRPATSMHITKQGVYFAGEYFDAMSKFTEIVRQATTSIALVDGYVDERVLNLVTAKQTGVTVELLTFAASPALITAGHAFNRQYHGLAIRTSKAFHDRFVMLDGIELYHFGASIKDLANRGFMYSRIEENVIADAVRQRYRDEWASAVVVI